MVAFKEVQLLDVTGPLQVFATTNEMIAKAGGTPPYTLRIVARQARSVAASAGVVLVTVDLPPLDTPVDTLIIAGGPGVKVAAAENELVSWVRARAQVARRTASVCTGAYLLAATGMLDGRRAATHWSFCDDLMRSFPAVHVEADPIFVRDGSVWTSAGVTSGIDLALALVEEDLGRNVALAVARYLVVFLKRPGGQAQFSAGPFTAVRGGAIRPAPRVDQRQSQPRSIASGAGLPGSNERAQFQPALSGGDRANARAGGGPAAGRGGPSASLGHQGPHQAYRAAMRLRNGGDDAAQLPAPAIDLSAGLSSALQHVTDEAP